MTVYAQIFSCDTPDSSSGIIVCTEHEKHIFNVGEGSQRLLLEHKVKLSKVENIYLSQINADTMGGLPGMLLTLADSGKEKVTLHGPPGTAKFLHATRHFMRRPDYAVKCKEDAKVCNTKELIVKKIILKIDDFSSNYADAEQSCKIMNDATHKAKRQRVDVKSNSYSNDIKQQCMCYIVQTPTIAGRLDISRALELGVPKGPLLGKLKNGIDITLLCGKIVHSKEVVAESSIGGTMAIVSCPDMKFLPQLLNHPDWNEWQQLNKPSIDVMIHLSPVDIVAKEDYRVWCNMFGSSICHIFTSRGLSHQHTAFQAALCQFQKIRYCCKEAFLGPSSDNVDSPLTQVPFFDGSVTQAGIPMWRYNFYPSNRQGPDTSKTLTKEGLNELLKQDFSLSWAAAVERGIESRINALRISQEKCSSMSFDKDYGPIITFLGTGSAQPSKYRNVSSILVELCVNGKRAGMLLDAGEGTMGQLGRMISAQESSNSKHISEFLGNLRAIWISHHHADHHLGLLQLLAQHQKCASDICKPLLLMAPRSVHNWLVEYYAINGDEMNYIYVDNACMKNSSNLNSEAANILKEELGLDEVWNPQVIHCKEAYALVIRSVQGWKLVYSGDTMPCDALVNAGMGATILIHEATFEDAKVDDAKEKRHSTVSQAIEIGKRMGAKHTILTHFSQRYPKLPILPISCLDADSSVSVAFDYMRVSLQTLPWLPKLVPVLQCMFPGVNVEDENDL